MNTELRKILADARAEYSPREMCAAIRAAHGGRLIHFVTPDNLHLFRRYRNTVSATPERMLADAEVLS